MNNNENSNSKNEKQDEKNEEKNQNSIHQNKYVNNNENNINEETKNKVTVKVEDNKKEMEKLNEDKTIPSEYMNYLNDYYNREEYNNNDDRPKNVITMNDIIGTTSKKEININIMNESFNNFYPGKVSTRSYGPIKAYAANTNQGIVRDYNEDRVSIIININQPNYSKSKKANWPKASYFSIFDGHGGNKCAEFLRDNLLKLICDNDFFPTDIEKAIKFGFSEADRLFLEIAVKDGKLVDSSGSCGLILLIIDNKIYIANVGDSRCIISMNNGKIRKDVTRDHKPNYPYEKKRIISNGGKIYQTQTPLNQKIENNNSNNSDDSFTENENINSNLILLGPHRVFPGSLSVSRTVGDAASKISALGGNPKVVISEPDIYCFELSKEDIDFIILGCDGIYDQLTSEEVIKCAWMMIDFSKKYNSKQNMNNNEKEEEEKDEIDLFTTCAHIVDFILKVSMSRKSFDNVTCLIVSFKDLINEDLSKNNTNKINFERKNEKEGKIEKQIILEDKKETKIPRLIISKTTDLLMEDNKNENKKIGNGKKKINIDKIQIKSIQKDDKNNINKNNYKLNKNIKLFGNNIENQNNNINSGELSHRVTSNNLLKEFNFKPNKNNENGNNDNINNKKNELSLSSTKIMKKSKSIESIIDRCNNNYNNTNKKLINNPISNINFINNSDEKNISSKKERLNISKKLFMNKKIKPLFIENKLNKNKYKNKNNTLRIATITPKNKNQSRKGGSLSKHGPVLSDLNIYPNKNINLKEINPITLTSNIPKITNINTITLKNSPKGKLSLNDLLSIGSNKIYSYRNKNGKSKLKSLNKKSISFYNKYNFNDFVSNPKIGGEKISLQKNQISKFDLFNKKSEKSTGSYVNIKNTNLGNLNKYQFSTDDKHKEKIEKPINLYPIYQNDYKISNGNNNSKRHIGSSTKVKTLVHNLTENLLTQNKRIGIPSLNGKNKIYNNISSIKKLNLI